MKIPVEYREKDKKMKNLFYEIEAWLLQNHKPYSKARGKRYTSLELETLSGQMLVVELEDPQDLRATSLNFYMNGSSGKIQELRQFIKLLNS